MSLEKLRGYARYPFTQEAKSYLNSLGMDLNSVDDSILEYSIKRIKSALAGAPEYGREQAKSQNEAQLRNEIISFPVAKILVSLSENRALRSKFAKAEALRVYSAMQRENEESTHALASQLFTVEKKKDQFLIPFQQYLQYVPQEKEYSLVNLELSKGKIRLDKEKLAKLVGQYVYHSVMNSKINKKEIKNKMFIVFSDELKQDKRYVVQEELGAVEFEAFPPCMKRIYQDLQSEGKVGHIPRFVFSTFVASIKMPITEAVGLFKSQPNFNEKKTRYYLEHSYGIKSSTKYSVPACAKIESYGICHRVPECRWKHPMTYYARMKRSRK
jgi:DNA primase large subunit